MPIYKRINNNGNRLIIWEIVENEDVLLENITLMGEEREKFLRIKNQEYRRCFLAVRNIFKELGIGGKVFYDCRKPIIENGYVSVSHSFKWAFVGVSERKIGVDVERISPRVGRAKMKFTEDNTADIRKLTQIWTAKESLYKAFGKMGIDFKRDIIVDEVGECVRGRVVNGGITENYEGSSFEIGGYVFCWVEQKLY